MLARGGAPMPLSVPNSCRTPSSYVYLRTCFDGGAVGYSIRLSSTRTCKGRERGMSITQIHITNVRGFDNRTLDIALRPNYVNILVAPNGFGKSSISTAFQCATGRKLQVDDADKHKKRTGPPSVLRLLDNGAWLEANQNKNEISGKYNIFVIKSNIEPKARKSKVNGHVVAQAYVEIPPIDFGPVAEKTKLNYNHATSKGKFSPNDKVVPNFEAAFSDERKRAALLDIWNEIGKLNQAKSAAFISSIIDQIKTLSGSKHQIAAAVESQFGSNLHSFNHLDSVFNVIMTQLGNNNWLESIILCSHLTDLFAADRDNLKKWLQHGAHTLKIKEMKSFIQAMNAAWIPASVKEVGGRITVELPDVKYISNGQRDLLYFACKLIRARVIENAKPTILVIDEIFDYLDDSNIIVAQYFLSKLIDEYKRQGREIYICLLTHLDPAYFKGYALKKQQPIYLDTNAQKISVTMQKVISDRENPVWKSDLDAHFLHYNPVDRDITSVFNSQFQLPKRYGNSHGFYDFIEEEWNKCSTQVGDYDPFAVCAHVRIKIEHCVFRKLASQADQTLFLQTNGTAKKLELAESLGIEIPEVCYLLGVLYNDALHKKNLTASSTISLRLRNLSLQEMIKKAIDW